MKGISTRKYTYYLSSIWKLLTGFKPWLKVVEAFLLPKQGTGLLVELRRSGLQFKVRSAMDIWSIKETFLDRFYERFGTPTRSGWSVVDIGGGIGEFAIYEAARHPENAIYAFEPTPQSYSLLQENLNINHLANVRTYPQAIWSESGTVMIDTAPGEPSQFTSLNQKTETITNYVIEVPSLSLKDAFELAGLSRCDLLKMDCEGAEYAILFNTPDQTLERIERIVMEYHETEAGYKSQDLLNFLAEKQFAVQLHHNYVHKNLGYLYAYRQ